MVNSTLFFGALIIVNDLIGAFEVVTKINLNSINLGMLINHFFNFIQIFADLDSFYVVFGFMFFGLSIIQSFFLMSHLGLQGIFLAQIFGLFIY
jgi:hypothetical protein